MEDTPPAGLRGLNALLQEEAAEMLTNVPDDPADPLRHHKETPKTCGDVKMVRTGGRDSAARAGAVFGERVYAPNANVCVELSPKVAESGATEPADGADKEAPTSGSSFERTITVVKGNSSLGL